MPKLKDFAEAKRKFKTDEDAENYFILVELYEKYLSEKQKEDFLSADTIDSMLDVLDSKQLRHLKNLVVALESNIDSTLNGARYPCQTYFKFIHELYSEWFRSNVLYRGSEEPFDETEELSDEDEEYSDEDEEYSDEDEEYSDEDEEYSDEDEELPPKPKLMNTIRLINKIIKHIRLNGKSIKQSSEETSSLIKQYKSRLKRFDGDSVEYRQWLILLDVDNSIPNIDRIYNVGKLLKQLDLERLGSLKKLIGEKNVDEIIKEDMKYLEPYYYWLNAVNSEYTSDDHSMDLGLGVGSSSHKTTDKGLVVAFNISLRELNSKIDKIIAEKTEEKEEMAELKIKGLVRSKRFGKDMMEIARLTVGTDDMILRNAISDYSRAMATGSAFNDYLRKATFLKKFKREMKRIEKRGGYSSASATMKFRKAIDKVYEYFINHLTSREYTVYRGMRSDGLAALLDRSNPRIEYEKNGELPILNETLISKINRCKPVVFDEGLTSTSLNKGVAAVGFGGKNKGNIFFTIKIPSESKALVLDYEEIDDVPEEEEVLLAPKTRIKIKLMKAVGEHYEIDAEVVK